MPELRRHSAPQMGRPPRYHIEVANNHYLDLPRTRLDALVHTYAYDSQWLGNIHRLGLADKLLLEFDRLRTGGAGLSS
jgi:hypothetical protein